MSVTEHSPIYGIAPTPFAVPPARQEWAETRLLLNVEIIWRTHRKPPNNSQRPSARIISAGDNAKAERSPACEAALTLAITLIASSAQTMKAYQRNNELVCRVRKPPEATRRWLQTEAVNKAKRGQGRGHSPIARPTSTPSARLPPSQSGDRKLKSP